jgi:hypothetical protein
MPIVFVDQRISINSTSSSGTTLLTATPLFIGDIGLQTLAIANSSVADDGRVALDSTVNVSGDVELFATVTLTTLHTVYYFFRKHYITRSCRF